jgi:hypothetical protein
MLQNQEISRLADGIEDGITAEIVVVEVAKPNILLAFHSPDVRSNTGDSID